ncbi:hypothetical protein [Desulfosporosinus sp.]|uniref:hypothetical protein n=1 Tax=Desulfosporosinus sp. TaxID=157907 RepID=UPI0025C576B2|nr:hypothetical protein [Desulfosporosinus sp.]MBC2722657.1 hypothetical protein [Desulfosporosinus sp.]MBC2727618.1 hypothetical protein [Desulfosporosinus sp.]
MADRVPWFVDVKELGGSIVMHAFAVGVITAIIDDPYQTAEETLQEIRGTLSDLKKVWSDGSISNGYRQEKALRANGEPRKKKSLRVYHGLRKSSPSILKK